MSNIKWTPAQLDIAKSMWTRGVSCTQIGIALGKSRNAIIGQVHRSGWGQHRQGYARKAPKAKTATPGKFDGRTFNARQRHAEHPPELTSKPLPPEPSTPPTCEPVTLMDRTPIQCGWILGETAGPATLMCGAPKDIEATYCGYHRAVSRGVGGWARPDSARRARPVGAIRTHAEDLQVNG